VGEREREREREGELTVRGREGRVLIWTLRYGGRLVGGSRGVVRESEREREIERVRGRERARESESERARE
jgi:hypothetical protein